MLQTFEKKFRDVIQAFKGEEGDVKAKLEKALRLREDHHSLPLPRDDYIEMVCGFADGGIKERYPKQLKYKLSFTENNPLKTGNLDLFNIITDPHSGTQVDPSMLLWCFGNQIKEGIAKAIKTWDWPAEVGLPRAERIIEIKKLDKEIEKLQAQLNRIRGIANSEGVSLVGVGAGVKGDHHLLKTTGKVKLS